MIPYILAAVGGYLVGQSTKSKILNSAANGTLADAGVEVAGAAMLENGGMLPLRQRQLDEQGYWDTEDTVEYLKKELERYKFYVVIVPYTEDDGDKRYIKLHDTDLHTIIVKNGEVTIEGKVFDLNESDTLGDIMDYILEATNADNKMKDGGVASKGFDVKKFTAFINFNDELRNLYFDVAESQGIESMWDVYHIQEGTEMPKPREIEIMKNIYNTNIATNPQLLKIYNVADKEFRSNVQKRNASRK